MTQLREAKAKAVDPLDRRRTEEQQPNEISPLHSFLTLQRQVGNRAVVQLFASYGQVQTKQRTSGAGDELEQEADRAAVQALNLSPAPAQMLQRKCADCSPTAKCSSCAEEEELQRKAKDSSVLSSTSLHIQRAPRYGNSPEPETTEETETSTARAFVVEDDAVSVAPGQMRKSEFLEQLRSTVCATANEALEEAGQSTDGCPYIEQWLSYYEDQPPAHIERALRKYAPEAATATSARDYIPAISNRVRRAVDNWARTGDLSGVPEELKGMIPGAGGVMGAFAGMLGGAISAAAGAIGGAFSSIGKALFKKKEGARRDDPSEVRQQLSGGHPLESSASSRMSAAFGHDFSGVRVHTDSEAASLSDDLSARAFTVGSDIAFGAGEYKPGTMIGDALIAHELAHVVQQGGGQSTSEPQSKSDAGHNALEEDADISAVGAVISTWSGVQGALGEIGRNAMPRMRSGLRLQSCKKYQTNRGMKVATRESGHNIVTTGPGGSIESVRSAPDKTEAQADAELGPGLLSRITKLKKPTNSYDCHGYTFLGGDKWIDDDEVPAILSDNGYMLTATPAVGDILIYRNAGKIKHSGVITEVRGATVTRITSKWGLLGLYSHAPDDVPASYGTWQVYHTTRRGGHRLIYK